MARRTNNDVTLNLTVLNNLLGRLEGNVADAIAKTGFSIEAHAKINAPVDTGALMNSIYTSLKGGGSNPLPTAGVEINPLPVPNDRLTAFVGPSVEYGITVEMGSVRRAATPFLLPAVRATEDEFRRLLSEAVTNG